MTPPALLSDLDARLRRQPRLLLLALGLACVLLLAVLESQVPQDLPLETLYVAPVLAVGWLTASLGCGLVVAAAASLAWPLAVLTGTSPAAAPSVLVAGTVVQMLLYAVLLCLLLSLRVYMEGREVEALRDELTGIANRRAFLAAAELELDRSRRYRHQLSLLYIDVDDFKEVNDRLGHQGGDRQLRRLADVLESGVRSVDMPARLGGDEFAVLMPETKSRAAAQLTERLLTALAAADEKTGVALHCSAGLITFRIPPRSAEEMLAAGDRLMYQAKDDGKERLCRAVLPAPKPGRRRESRSGGA